jgi:hypothetical protein
MNLASQLLLSALLTGFVSSVVAQKVPPPSRTVFKCEVHGKVVYSDSPCLGATKINVEPTRGLNRSSGQEQVGKDVRNERLNEVFAEAVRPITGKDAKQQAVATRRFKLPPEAQRECRQLDLDMQRQEAAERTSSTYALPEVKKQLLASRSRSRALGC